MVSKRTPLDEALATARANKYGRMVGRGKDNRIEPECWPHVQPSFQFTKEQSFFAIGSCFAKNISKRLALDGYNVLGTTTTHGEHRNRYTPPAIFQELAWAGAIYRRDDQVRDEDVQPLLLELGKDKWADMWSRPERGAKTTLKETIEKRKALYSYFRGAFKADVVIITLGLIEAWWDDVSRSYVEFDTPWARRSDRERFRFELLSFDQCKDYIERSLQLLLDGRRRLLLTTSPVILARTFTDKDIIVANSHSKSVLRAVCGELTEEHDGVDYFPSYEIATLTRRPEVWDGDLVHIQPNFIARIMQHVTNAYVPGSVGTPERTLMHMANLVEALQYDDACSIYESAGEAVWESANPAVHVGAMRLAARTGNEALAVRHALRVDDRDELLYTNHPEWMFNVALVLAGSPEHGERGQAIKQRVEALSVEQPNILKDIFVERQRAGDDAGMREVIALIRKTDVNHPTLMHKVCQKLHEYGETAEALALADRQLARTPSHTLMLARRARLLLALNRPHDAVAPLEQLRELEPANGWAHLTLARTLNKAGRTSAALEAADAFIERFPGDAQGLALKARLLSKLLRHDEAAEAGKAAIAAAAGDPLVLRDVQLLLALRPPDAPSESARPTAR